jgi:hypothetical protein
LVIALTIVAVAVIGGAIFLARRDGAKGSSQTSVGWNSYENREHAYRIEYPAQWKLTETPTSCDVTFCTQSIELSRADQAAVYVFVNFMGGWCEGSEGQVVTDIVLSGHPGREYRCPGFTIRSFSPGDSLIRYFPGAQGKLNYLVLGQDKAELSEVEAVVQSFQFLN